MDDKNTYLHVLLLLNIIAVSSYLQFVVPGVTEADSSPVRVSIIDSKQYPYWPNRTVDGNFSQNIKACLHTAVSGVTEAWLRIDLQTVRSIKSVKFWYRNDRSSAALNTVRLKGYSIRVSNRSNASPGSADVCFTDDMSHTLPTAIQEDCKRTTRYIWFYQSHVRGWDDKVPILEICEVQIFGCETGTYGANCSKTCSHCKNSETCDIATGECDDNGCALPGFKSPMCSACRNGTFGVGCMHRCTGNCLNNETCDKSDGGCRTCAPGWEGHLCNKTCDIGHYGLNCQHVCGHCFKAEQCFHTNGSCSGGCMEGYRGGMCSETKGVLRSTQDPETPYVAGIAVLVGVIVILVIVIAVLVVMLRTARETNTTNNQVNEIDMYDLPNVKPETSLYDIISIQ